MSVTSKMMNFGNQSTAVLEKFQMKLQEGLIETKGRIKILMQKVTAFRAKIEKLKDDEETDHTKEIETLERKISVIKDELSDIKDEYKDDMESLKAVEQVLKIREEKRLAKANRLYGGLGALAIVGGVGLAYGSDTWGTLINKHTMDAVKLAVTRFLPKFV